MKRVASKQTVLNEGKQKKPEASSEEKKKKNPIDCKCFARWGGCGGSDTLARGTGAQKRASKLILAPQGRLTEFKAYQEGGMQEEDLIQSWDQAEPPKEISLSSLSDLIPICIARDLSERPQQVAMTPSSQQIQASCLFLDVSQFTAISEHLSSEGMRGPERLAQHINQLFTQLLRIVGKAGGDIFKFAGDAVIVLWPVDLEAGENLAQVAHRAVQCACDVQETLPKMEIPGEEKFSLAFKCGVGVGTVAIVHLGGGKLLGLDHEGGGGNGVDAENRASRRDLDARHSRRVMDPRTHSLQSSTSDVSIARREYVAVGDPLKQAFSAEKLASRNDIIVSRQTWSLVSEHFSAKVPKGGKLAEGFVLVDEKGRKDLIKKRKPKEFQAPQKEWMLTYIPRSAHLFLEVEHHTRKDWVSELRRVTVLFINMGGACTGRGLLLPLPCQARALTDLVKTVPKQELATILTKHEGVDRLHEYFSAVQRAVLDYEGSINKFLMDDKGSTVIAVFGLPPISHENDATRGVLASLVRAAAQTPAS
jgi:class 3 adenylate cyclase